MLNFEEGIYIGKHQEFLPIKQEYSENMTYFDGDIPIYEKDKTDNQIKDLRS